MDEPDPDVESGPIWPPDEIIGQTPAAESRPVAPADAVTADPRAFPPPADPRAFPPPFPPDSDGSPRHAGQSVPLRRSPWSQPPRTAHPSAPTRALPPVTTPAERMEAPGVYRLDPRPDPVPASPRAPISAAVPGARLVVRDDAVVSRRSFAGLRQVSVVNPGHGAGKTVTTLLLAMMFGQRHAGSVLAWDRSTGASTDTAAGGVPGYGGTLSTRAEAAFHDRTSADLIRVSGDITRQDLARYVRQQAGGMFDVLAGPDRPGADRPEAAEFARLRDLLARFYHLIIIDAGGGAEEEIDATDQLVVTMSARGGSAEAAARMLDHLERSGRRQLARRSVTIVAMPSSRREIDVRAMTRHFGARTRAVLIAPFDRGIDSGGPVRYDGLSAVTREAWSRIAATVSDGL